MIKHDIAVYTVCSYQDVGCCILSLIFLQVKKVSNFLGDNIILISFAGHVIHAWLSLIEYFNTGYY